MKKIEAPVFEIFSSYQGEGLFVGQKQIFVGFSGCNLECSYCDEKASKKSGSMKSMLWVVDRIKKLSRRESIRVVSLTGGEPLLYSDFIKCLIEKLGNGFLYMLETNGVLHKELKKIIGYIDTVSMDIKFPQYCGRELWDEHEKFLKISSAKDVYVKVVVARDIKISDFKKAVLTVYSVSDKIPFFIQPVTENGNVSYNIDFIDMLYEIASKKLLDVRFLPQIHKILKIK
jgi:organic radical activating enzyme